MPPSRSEERVRPFEHKRVALLESRKAAELTRMVERLGATVVSVPSVRETPRHEGVEPVLRQVIGREFDLLIALTGAACEALFAEADKLGVVGPLGDALSCMTLACRGPKPFGVLRKRGFVPDVQTVKPHTTEELAGALSTVELAGRRVLLLEYGERNVPFADRLCARGARLTQLCLYEWELPEDLGGLKALIADTIAHRIDVMIFTSQIQFRHLLQIAQSTGQADELLRALRDDVITGAIGPVTTHALRDAGVVPDVIPAVPNAASLVQAVAEYVGMFQT